MNILFTPLPVVEWISSEHFDHLIFIPTPGVVLKKEEIPPTINKILDYVSKIENQDSLTTLKTLRYKRL